MQPLRSKGKQQQVARTATIPAPTAGWYVGDNQAQPPPKTAIVLTNGFPELDYVRPRGGSAVWASGVAAAVSTLMTWTNGIADRMFAVGGGSIYDVSSSGVVGAAEVSGLSTSYLQSCQFEGLGGTYLIAVTGDGDPHIFDGTGWDRTFALAGTLSSGSPSVTGLSSTANLQPGMALSGTGVPAGTTIASVDSDTAITLSANATVSGSESLTFYQNAPITGYPGSGFSFVWTYEGRLYFIDGRTLNVYYLGLAAIGGPAIFLPLSAFFTYGGYLIAGARWSLSTAYGSFLANVFISSEGEINIYRGDYPGATNWSTVGHYKISRPLGPNCLMQSGGDLLVMTEDGIVALSQVMTVDQVALENVALTKPVLPAWRDAVLARAGLQGWQITPWLLRAMVVVNLPKLNSGDFTQFLANSRTGAWAKYEGWDANCFAVFGDALFYGDSAGNVLQAETGSADAGVDQYTLSIMCAFSQLGAPAALKQVRAIRPYVLAATDTNPQVTVAVDFNTTLPTAPQGAPPTSGPLWDVAVWDVDVWGGALVSQNAWLDAQGVGSAIGVTYQATFGPGGDTPDVRIAAFDVLFETGNIGLG